MAPQTNRTPAPPLFLDGGGSHHRTFSVSDESAETPPSPSHDGEGELSAEQQQQHQHYHDGTFMKEVPRRTVIRRPGIHFPNRDISSQFVVRSIPRSSSEWVELITPFVSDLVFYSLETRRHDPNAVCFRPYSCHAAVLFVDLSGYSKITSDLAHRGAHAISKVVNAYLTRLLEIIRVFGGDICKFAGDAVLVVWEGTASNLYLNVVTAAKCAMELQLKAASHEVQGSRHVFRLHCGLACGRLESEVFQAPTHLNMQRLYHSLGGEPVEQIGELVDMADKGEVCVSKECAEYLLDEGATFRDVLTQKIPHRRGQPDAKILQTLPLDRGRLAQIDHHAMQMLTNRITRRISEIVEEFIHPSVLRLLRHSGLTPTQIAQMRNLCVLFIARKANGSAVNWLMEVQGILDRNRCPILQIIHDDKGVHVVAAVNLYEAIPETALQGLQICKELKEQMVGCAIGMSMGTTFCGVTGSNTIACRWDIVGPPAVRAARLMQYAIKHCHEVVIDESVNQDRMVASQLTLLSSDVRIKGTAEPCSVYTLSESQESAALRILETEHASIHDDEVQSIYNFISQKSLCTRQRAVVIAGPSLSGKKTVAQRAAGLAGLTPFLHVSAESAGHLQLARTIALWYRYMDDRDVKTGAKEVLQHLDAKRWSCAHDACVLLVNLAVKLGLKACFVVDRIQFLDSFSFSLIQECLHGDLVRNPRDSESSWANVLLKNSERSLSGIKDGRIYFLCVHVALYQHDSAQQVAARISRASIEVPVVTVGQVTEEELRSMYRELADIEVHDRWLKTYARMSGFCAGYFVERALAARAINWRLRTKSLNGAFSIINEDMMLQIPTGMVRKNWQLTVHEVNPDVAMEYTQVFDELPPLFQTLLKVLTVATGGDEWALPKDTMWKVLNDAIAEGISIDELGSVIKELEASFLITTGKDRYGNQTLSLINPALGDIAFDLCIPSQIDSICQALLGRISSMQHYDCCVPFVMARFLRRLEKRKGQNRAEMIRLWQEGYNILKENCDEIPQDELHRKLEAIDEEILSYGFSAKEILGSDFGYPAFNEKGFGGTILLYAKNYVAPIAFGPLGHTLSVLCRNVFHEMKHFRGGTDEEKCVLLDSYSSARKRYCKEVEEVERFLGEYGLEASSNDLRDELDIIWDIALKADSPAEVQHKANRVHKELIPLYVESRRLRLLRMVRKVQAIKTPPWPIFNSEHALKQAFEAMHAGDFQTDSAHHALMILAVNQWRPKRVPEYLPMMYYQSPARLLDKVLRELNEAELAILRHRQGPEDLAAFLILTPLLYQWYL